MRSLVSKKVLILGANGFIGSHLSEAILTQTTWSIQALDLNLNNLTKCLNNPRFSFKQGDMTKESAWIQDAIHHCDVVLPLVAIASPMVYVQNPLRVFELDFEANLEIVRYCVEAKKRLIFPSTSEVYGMCPDNAFDEETSSLVLGPIQKQRWIYACSKQMLDRVIYAYGERDGLDYTLFRPFNWLGPRLDTVEMAKTKSARVITQFLYDITTTQRLHLVDGGAQRRSFTDSRDGIAGLMAILENKDNAASQGIFNLGNPDNEFSIRDLANKLLNVLKETPKLSDLAHKTEITTTEASAYYGNAYQDPQRRVPSIERAKTILGWQPQFTLEDTLKHIVAEHVREHYKSMNVGRASR